MGTNAIGAKAAAELIQPYEKIGGNSGGKGEENRKSDEKNSEATGIIALINMAKKIFAEKSPAMKNLEQQTANLVNGGSASGINKRVG